jgi:hypothetical protein
MVPKDGVRAVQPHPPAPAESPVAAAA